MINLTKMDGLEQRIMEFVVCFIYLSILFNVNSTIVYKKTYILELSKIKKSLLQLFF